MTDRIKEILREFGRGCSNGKAGECSDCLDAAVSAIKPELGWHPIDTAPKDKTEILVTDGMFPSIVYWSRPTGKRKKTWVVNWNRDPYSMAPDDPSPTHWMPLPAPPPA